MNGMPDSSRTPLWALVTGASSGIGFAIARRLAIHYGYNLILVSHNDKRLETALRTISPLCPNLQLISVNIDLALHGAARKLFSECAARNIHPQVIVNNAGVFIFNDLIDTDINRIERLLYLHVFTVTETCRLFGAEMARNGGGYILNMASYSAWMPFPGIALYNASKAYIRNFSKSIAGELKNRNIGITAVAPAGVATDLYGLSPKLQRVGLKLGVLMSPEKVARKALKAMFKKKRHTVPGWYNRLFIPFLLFMPQTFLRFIHKKLAPYRQ